MPTTPHPSVLLKHIRLADTMTTQSVVAIIGAGGMGINAARQIAHGRKILLADFSETALQSAAESLRGDGHVVETHTIDVGKHGSVTHFAQACTQAGRLESVVHTAGLSPNQATAARVYEVDLLGTANVLDAFLMVAHPGMTMVCIASMAAAVAVGLVSPELEVHLATAPLDKLLNHPNLKAAADMSAYSICKHGNIVRVQALAKAYGLKGARVNSISPGVISTPMAQHEFKTSQAVQMNSMIEMSALGRIGTPQDVANAIEFLTSTKSSFITGNDILVDGGGVSASRWNKYTA